MERRALLAAVVSLLILIGYQGFLLPWLFPPVVPEPQEERIAPTTAGESARTTRPDQPADPAAAPAPAPERLITVATDNFVATLSSRGARLVSFTLKGYRTSVAPDSANREMVLPTADGRQPIAVELRGANSANGSNRTVVLADADAAYAVEHGANEITLAGEQEMRLEFVWRGAEATVRKIFTFRGDRPDFAVDVRADDIAPRYSEIGVAYASATKAEGEHEVLFDRASYFQGKKLNERFAGTSDLTDGEIVAADPPIGWSNLAGIYFIAAIIPDDTTGARLWLKQRESDLEQKLLFPLTGGAFARRFDIYLGSKRMETLEVVGHNLARTVDMGWFSFIALPLLWILRKSHTFTANYGVDIILLTVLIKLAFLPLTRKSFQSMKEMQKLQPQMNDLRERYKDDSETLNKEMMELFRRHKVNPLGGCLPMLVQIPVFVGLYQALSNAVELRHAPFALWINDLSAPDRLGTLSIPFVEPAGIPVLTLFMGGSMFVQQWMTPSTGDPQQRQMMMIMPLVFTFMFLNFPAGLSLYWTVSNILTVAQQYYINRSVK